MKERRRCYRLQMELPVSFRASKYQRHISLGLTQNISATGLCFLTTQGVEVGQELKLDIQIPPEQKLTLTTEVVWVRETGYISRDYYIGVRLKEPVDEDAHQYVRFCAQSMHKLRQKREAGPAAEA